MPYKPNDVTVDISTAAFLFVGPPDSPGEVPDRLDVSWTTPTLDAATQLFETADGGEMRRNKQQNNRQTKNHASFLGNEWLCPGMLGSTISCAPG